jgi:diadenosine tetraphosphate (Ap4A) HIT family hydrolase
MGTEININKCIFCDWSSREILVEDEHAVAFFDAFPVNPGHVLVIPKKHVADYFDLEPALQQACMKLLNQAKVLIQERYNPEGFNIGINAGAAAGQTIFHVHLHLIPRYLGDMPDPRGGVRGVIPDRRSY